MLILLVVPYVRVYSTQPAIAQMQGAIPVGSSIGTIRVVHGHAIGCLDALKTEWQAQREAGAV
jgi:hypothetical protein